MQGNYDNGTVELGNMSTPVKDIGKLQGHDGPISLVLRYIQEGRKPGSREIQAYECPAQFFSERVAQTQN